MQILNKKYFIIGMMGVGKTSVAKELGKRLRICVEDLDEYMENINSDGLYTVSDIFESKGELFFRSLEKESLKEIIDENEKKNFVLSLGGGTVLDEENRKLIRKSGNVIWLKAKPETIFNRIKNENTRPLLKQGNLLENIKNILDSRNNIYDEMSDIVIETDGKTIKEVSDEVMDVIYKEGDIKEFNLIGSVGGKNFQGTFDKLEDTVAEIIEIRYDSINVELETLKKYIALVNEKYLEKNYLDKKKWLFTYRTEIEKQKSNDSSAENILIEAIDLRIFDYIDIEKKIYNEKLENTLAKKKEMFNENIKYIISQHIYYEISADKIKKLILEMEKSICDIVKVALLFKDKEKAKNILEEISDWQEKRQGKPLIFIPMGESCSALRKELYKYAFWGSFGYINKPLAEGQISVEELFCK